MMQCLRRIGQAPVAEVETMLFRYLFAVFTLSVSILPVAVQADEDYRARERAVEALTKFKEKKALERRQDVASDMAAFDSMIEGLEQEAAHIAADPAVEKVEMANADTVTRQKLAEEADAVAEEIISSKVSEVSPEYVRRALGRITFVKSSVSSD